MNAQETTGPAVAASDSTVAVVKSKGQGETPEKAEKSALLRAVVQAVGALVDQETLVKNDELVRDQILSVSSGFVKSFKVLSEPKKNLEGDFETVLEVVVEKRKLEKSLTDKGLVKAKSNTSDVWAETLSKTASADDAKRMLEAKLPTLIERLFSVGFFEENPKPVFLSKDSSKNTAKLLWWVKISSDRDFFYSQVAPMLDACLTAIIEDERDDVSAARAGKGILILPKKQIPVNFRVPHMGHKWERTANLREIFKGYRIDERQRSRIAEMIGFPAIDVESRSSSGVINRCSISLLSDFPDMCVRIIERGRWDWLYSRDLGTFSGDDRYHDRRRDGHLRQTEDAMLRKITDTKPKTAPIGYILFPSLNSRSLMSDQNSLHTSFSSFDFYDSFNSELFKRKSSVSFDGMFYIPELIVERLEEGTPVFSTASQLSDVAFPIILDVPLSETNGTLELSVKVKRN